MTNLLIRAEDKNKWERRTPLVPDDVAKFISETNAKVLIQKSEKRVYGQSRYEKIGAKTCEEMDQGDLILGIKEIPAEKILANKTYVFFSHTIKGQKENMPLLKKIMDSESTLIDYEKITDDQRRRLIFFGPFAGQAGAIDILSLMGEHWADKGLTTPFSEVRRAHQYESLEEALVHLASIGKRIEREGLPSELCPLTVGILGYGNVSRGAQQIFNCLPTQPVAPEDINAFVEEKSGDNRTVYTTIFHEEHLVKPKAKEAQFDLNEYFGFPERYESRFERFLPSFTLLVNAVYWEKRYPRFVTNQGLKSLAQKSARFKLNGIADITCDTFGSVECNVKSTDSDMPGYRVDPITGGTVDGHLGEGIVLLAVDNLPCELPADSSTYFSNQLRPFIPNLMTADYQAMLSTSGLRPELQRATIVYKGQLTDDYLYLQAHL